LDIFRHSMSNGSAANGMNGNPSMEVCYGCGIPNHSRPNCPFKDHPQWVARGKRTHPIDLSFFMPVNNTGSGNSNQYQSTSLSALSSNLSSMAASQHNLLQPSDSNQPYTDNESITPTHQNSSDSTSSMVHKYDRVSVPRISGLIQSTINQSAAASVMNTLEGSSVGGNQAINVSIMLDPSKVPNTISSSMLHRLCSITDVSLSRRTITVPTLKAPLSYYIRLKIHLTDLNVTFLDDFYIQDFMESTHGGEEDANPSAFQGIQLGFYTICQYNLLSFYQELFTKQRLPTMSSDSMMATARDAKDKHPSYPTPSPAMPGSPNSHASEKSDLHGTGSGTAIASPAIAKSPSDASSMTALAYLNDESLTMLPSANNSAGGGGGGNGAIHQPHAFGFYGRPNSQSQGQGPSQGMEVNGLGGRGGGNSGISSSPQWFDLNSLSLDLGNGSNVIGSASKAMVSAPSFVPNGGYHHGMNMAASSHEQEQQQMNGSKYNLWS
jgi:hypothetical protein